MSATQLTGVVPASSLATLGWHQLAVVNPAPGGGTTPALTLTVFSVVKAGANRILYEPFSRQIYATLGSAMPLGNSVEAIDPATGSMSTPVFIGSEPTRMALSDNGEVLYASASDANEVVRFNTLTQKTEGSFGLQTGFGLDNSAATEMAVQPGTGNTVVVSYAGAQVVDFDPVAQTSAARPKVLASGLVSPRFLNDTDVIGYGDYAFSRFAVTSSGLGGAPLSHFTGDASPFKLANGLAFVNNGTVVDVTSRPNSLVGTFPFSPAYYGSACSTLSRMPNSDEPTSFSTMTERRPTPPAELPRALQSSIPTPLPGWATFLSIWPQSSPALSTPVRWISFAGARTVLQG